MYSPIQIEAGIFCRNLSPSSTVATGKIRSALFCKTNAAVVAARNTSIITVTPLACYWDDHTHRVCAIVASDISEFMRAIASELYDLHPVKEAALLRKWSSHSLRIGACNILHAMGFSPLDIQWLLRWKSNAFMAYLRNLSGLATRQHVALDKAAEMPHLF